MNYLVVSYRPTAVYSPSVKQKLRMHHCSRERDNLRFWYDTWRGHLYLRCMFNPFWRYGRLQPHG